MSHCPISCRLRRLHGASLDPWTLAGFSFPFFFCLVIVKLSSIFLYMLARLLWKVVGGVSGLGGTCLVCLHAAAVMSDNTLCSRSRLTSSHLKGYCFLLKMLRQTSTLIEHSQCCDWLSLSHCGIVQFKKAVWGRGGQ